MEFWVGLFDNAFVFIGFVSVEDLTERLNTFYFFLFVFCIFKLFDHRIKKTKKKYVAVILGIFSAVFCAFLTSFLFGAVLGVVSPNDFDWLEFESLDGTKFGQSAILFAAVGTIYSSIPAIFFGSIYGWQACRQVKVNYNKPGLSKQV